MNFEDNITANGYDDFPLWSAVPGLLLLENIRLIKDSKILDIGCGTGFPTIEIAQRIGNTAKIYGLDIWEKGLEKARNKANNKNIKNIEFIKGSSQKIPFKNEYFDEIVSNNAYNGENANITAFNENYRVLKNGGIFCFTAILSSSMKNFYKKLYIAMKKNNIKNAKEIIDNHIKQKRLTINSYKQLLKESNFKNIKFINRNFYIRFADFQAFWEYYFFRLNFVENWIKIIPSNNREKVIEDLKQNINNEIKRKGLFSIKINCVCMVNLKSERKKCE